MTELDIYNHGDLQPGNVRDKSSYDLEIPLLPTSYTEKRNGKCAYL